MESHSVTCHPAAVTFPPALPQLKLVLDLATPKGCKAELTWVVRCVSELLNNKKGIPVTQHCHIYKKNINCDRDHHLNISRSHFNRT